MQHKVLRLDTYYSQVGVWCINRHAEDASPRTATHYLQINLHFSSNKLNAPFSLGLKVLDFKGPENVKISDKKLCETTLQAPRAASRVPLEAPALRNCWSKLTTPLGPAIDLPSHS